MDDVRISMEIDPIGLGVRFWIYDRSYLYVLEPGGVRSVPIAEGTRVDENSFQIAKEWLRPLYEALKEHFAPGDPSLAEIRILREVATRAEGRVDRLIDRALEGLA